MSVSLDTCERVALEDTDAQWELACDRRRAQPGMTAGHNDVSYARTPTTWRRPPDGAYTEKLLASGILAPAALPGVRIDLASLFHRQRAGASPACTNPN